MPTKSQKYCSRPGCATLVDAGYCPDHTPTPDRPTAAERGYGRRWQKARKFFLAKHPLCVHCLQEDRTTAATDVDHIIPHGGDMDLFWNMDNWQPLCTRCHRRKTAQEQRKYE